MRISSSSQKKFTKEVDENICLGKTEMQDDGSIVPGASVYHHCVAVGRIARVLAEQNPVLSAKGFFVRGFDLVCALHDVGKVSPSFQIKLAKALGFGDGDRLSHSFDLKDDGNFGDIPHNEVSYAAVYKRYGKQIAYIEGLHHGALAHDNSNADAEIFGGPAWQAARERLMDKLEQVFGSEVDRTISDSEVRFLAGLVIVSDWLGSSMTRKEVEAVKDSVFIEKVIASGFRKHEYIPDLTFRDVFGFDPRPEQLGLIEEAIKPGVFILEAGTGSGKTEAALYAAYKMLQANQASGLYFALPTALTARQIHERVESFLIRITGGKDKSAKLVYSNSMLYSSVYSNGFPETTWFDSRKRLLLAPFGVGTIDQALMSVINVRHSSVRSFALAGKVVILDEVHSYDSYTSTLVGRLVSELSNLGATVLILSATLTVAARSFLLGMEEQRTLPDSYPSVTGSVDGMVQVRSVETEQHRTVQLVHENSRNEALSDALEKAVSGKYVLWIENTVDEAQEAYSRLVTSAPCGCGIGLLHSRFLGHDRTQKEKEYISRYGKQGWNNRDGNGFILVGTQILEQSLDIDCDELYTSLAPVDMIFQRLGRLWRHSHTERVGVPVCHIIHPTSSEVESNPNVLGPSAYVYEGYVLYRTIVALNGINSISVPEDVRPVLESVYYDRIEDSPNIRMLRRKLNENKKKLTALAIRAQSTVGIADSDTENALTRYSEMKTVRVMILADIDFDNSSVKLTTGENLNLGLASTPKEKAATSLKLEESILKIPVSRLLPNLPVSNALNKLLSRFVYCGDESDPLYVLLKTSSSELADVYGNKVRNCCYSVDMGYHFRKEV